MKITYYINGVETSYEHYHEMKEILDGNGTYYVENWASESRLRNEIWY